MADFLLIHGSCHGAWCWRDVIPALAALGHSARAIDLPSHGADATPPGDITLAVYARAIADAVTPGTVIVGHSMAGYPITAAAELVPDHIARLIYLCAYVPMPGLSLAQMRRMATSQPLLDAIIVDEGRVTFSIDPAKAVAKFFHDVVPSTARRAVAQLGPQPILPQETPLWPDRALCVPRSYIRCLDDRTIPPEFQSTMTQGWPAHSLHELPTSHSPFLSAPAALACLLDHIVIQG